ncbi:S-layer homology domain-containing protein [Cohnella fermenti]|uniref:S-layer homology domain-containing protein n=1 Tax=Cohnella fermenti TaxID=2565925 RepID=A0A4S4C621_9BACL|nr:S-layer homology domain-containing protein [Cohnella fermenti]THF83312.1 S-layer homology domain-containing protein [Cohnella fermenti]
MNRTALRAIAMLLAAVLILTSVPLHSIAGVVASAETTSIENGYVKVTVDNASGRYSVRTVDGQPIRKKDGNVDLIFEGDNPETSFTTFKIDGTEFIFGNPYKLAVDWFSEVTEPVIVKNDDGTESLITVWTIKGIRISQIITLILTDDLENAGNVRISYQVDNTTDSTVEVGTRVLLDTSIGGNDGPAFQIGQNYLQPLSVERKLVHEPEDLGYDINVDEQAYNLHKLPAYWVMRDRLDLSNPLATNVIAYGFNNLFEGGINIVDEMIVGHWNGLANSKWDYEPNENLDFTLNTNEYGTADTAVAYYWQPDPIAAGASKTYEVVYGLGEIVAPDKVFDVRFLDTVQKLAANEEETGYENDGIFEINAEIENLAMYDMEHSKITVTLQLENGLTFVDESGRELGGSAQTLEFKKDIPPEEASQGIEVIPYKPGEIISAKWRVKASGRPWPTTRQYLVSVSSPETEQKLETKLAEAAPEEEAEIRAVYESSKANFVFLPPVGELSPTIVYAMTPGELYYKDDKHISLNVSNIAAYDPGSVELNSSSNFELYLKNAKSGDRYKVPVSSSVTTQPLGNGFAGDMRIVFRGGELVDSEGKTIETIDAQSLPLGEYSVVVDFKDKSDADIAEALSFETETTFQVTVNEETRLRKASILAVSKRLLDLTASGAQDRERFAEALPKEYGSLSDSEFIAKRSSDKAVLEAASGAIATAAKKVNPDLSLKDAIDLSAVPVYTVNAFDSEDALAAFKDKLAEEDDHQEIVLEVRGSIVQSGEGANAQYTVSTDAEPAIINKSVAYKGKDLSFPVGEFPLASRVGGNTDTPFLHSLFAVGDGTLSIANSGFIFHKGEWTVDFYNGFDKSLGTGYSVEPEQEEWESARNPGDDSLNGNLQWANGLIADAINPFQNLLVSHVYFNRQSLFATPSFSISGFSLQLRDFILREDGVSFGGSIKLAIVDGEVKNVIFNQEGFVGIDTSLKFQLDKTIGLFKPTSDDKVGGEIDITHYKDPNKYDVQNSYGIKFEAKLEKVMSITAELAFKQVADGRILPDVIAFGTDLPDPGITVAVATYITSIRGAVRELANTIAGGERNIPLTLEAGVDMKVGVKPAVFSGTVDLTLKSTGFKVVGTLGLGEDDDVIKMLTEALIQTQWASPMFLTARATVDVAGWGIIVGKASIFIGENLEKHRTDFEGMISAKLQVPQSVPVVGGIGFGVRAGANNDKVWAGISLLFFSLGVTYYWGGGIAFGTDGSPEGKDALMYLLVDDPELGPTVMAIGEGVEVLATSWENEAIDENETQEIKYTAVGEGISLIDDGSSNLGIGGIVTSNGSKVHSIPMNKVTGDALLEVEYDETQRPKLKLTREDGSEYGIVVGDITDSGATAFEQIIPALREGDVKSDGTTVTKQEALASTDVRRLYIAVPESEAKTGNWTLTSDRPIRTKLMNVPVQPALTETALATDSANSDRFTASWTVKNASVGDAVSLYLSKDKLSAVPNPDEEVDPGLLIARDIEVQASDIAADGTASGTIVIDASSADTLGGVDIRGLLPQGEYYLRTELKTETAFSALSSADTFRIVDPLAPDEVEAIDLKAAGNGMFDVAFRPVEHKAGQEDAQYGYVFTALDKDGNVYEPFGEVMYTEEQLESSLQDGEYRLTLGGWSLVGKPKLDEEGNLLRDSAGNIVMDNVEDRYTGLETGKQYSIGIQTVRIPSDGDGASDNMRFAETAYSASVLLPVPAKPVLSIEGKTLQNNRYDLMTNETVQEISLSADQPNVIVEAYADDESLGSVELGAKGTAGKLKLTRFATDGTYAVELRARNKATGDYSVSMLYLTVDTTAPMIYLDAPDGGFRSVGGQVVLKGTSNADATLTVSNADTREALATYKPDDKGEFAIDVPTSSANKTIRLRIEARDEAGNANSAVTEVLNDDLKLPKKLKLSAPSEIASGGGPVQLEAVVEYEDGSRGLADASKLTFAVEQGDSNALLSADGQLVGRREGSALITVDYTPWEGLTLTSSDVVSISAAEGESVPTTMGTIKASTAGTGRKGESRVLVTSVGHNGNMTGSELAYRIYSDKDQAVLPTFDQDISAWRTLPASGVIEANDGEYVVVAKRLKDEPKLTVASSPAIRVYEYIASPTSGAAGIITIGGVSIDISRGGSSIKLPLLLNGTSTEGLIVADVDAEAGTYRLTVKPAREAFLASIEKGNLTLSLPVKGGIGSLSFELDAELIQAMQRNNVTLDIETDSGRYILNPQALDLKEIAALYLGKALKEIAISVTVAKASAESIKLDKKTTLVGEPVEFRIEAAANGKSAELRRLASFVEREIPLPAGVTEQGVSTAIAAEEDGTPRHAPTRIVVREGKYYAHVSSMSNSVYALIDRDSSFKDTNGHWAAEAIDDLASRLIVSGTGEGLFQPSLDMTRAEFAAILVKALGLAPAAAGGTAFSDVSEKAWYYQAVHTANSYGLIGGYGNGRFGPNDKTTREQAMVILAKALRLTGHGATVGQAEAADILAAFADVSASSAWARSDMASAVKTGLFTGQKADRLAPKALVTRAEIAVAVRRLLKASELLD